MKSIVLNRRSVAAFALVLGLTGCATPPPPSVPQPPSSARLSTPLDRTLAAQASAFESFMRHARGIDPDFSGPADVSHALQTGAAHDPKQLEAGMVAYAALAALQEPRFVAAVRADHGDLSRRLAVDPSAVLDVPGGQAAAARASGALFAQGAGLDADGQRVKRAAYSVQHQSWSKAPVPDAAGRLSRVKRLSAAGYQPSRDDPARLQTALTEGARRNGIPSPVVARGVALAALSVMGEEGRGRALMSEPRTASCLRLAKLNLYQCLAASGPQYEDVYCLGQHAMIDPGQCVIQATQPPKTRPAARVTRASYPR